MKARYIIFLFIIFFNVKAEAGVSSLFEKSLMQYCVPKNAAGCVNNKATYSNGNCVCSSGIYIDRECFNPNCPAGTYLVYDNYSDDCPVGSARSKVKD